ncbi:MAG TPA: hypothetical protein VM869_17345 [Enhygromyxa sp.]|nr:hypothetical protein [Enhygromyxa sp.]
MHKLLVRAIITGFGLRVGAELGKYIAHKVLPKEKDKGGGDDEEDESLGTITADPPQV